MDTHDSSAPVGSEHQLARRRRSRRAEAIVAALVLAAVVAFALTHRQPDGAPVAVEAAQPKG